MASDEAAMKGNLYFAVEARVLRELGERLVRQPEVAIVELIKNAYDADASTCTITRSDVRVQILDDGNGMTFDRFRSGWMRVGTDDKAKNSTSAKYSRAVTGEKGIGRFAARFLGTKLELATVAYDESRQERTKLTATFDWPEFDAASDISKILVPYTLLTVPAETPTGTSLTITGLRRQANNLDLRAIRSQSLAVVSPIASMLASARSADGTDSEQDPGLQLIITGDNIEPDDVGRRVLEGFVHRAVINIYREQLRLEVYRRGETEPFLTIADRYENSFGTVRADIRFFPRRSGSFVGLGLDGRAAYSWIRNNSGVAVYDRGFRVAPYGQERDDWLLLQSDGVKNERRPRSSIAQKFFPMDPAQFASTSTNWMLRLPDNAQLIGVVEVEGQRTSGRARQPDGLVAAADREGFIENEAFERLVDLVRGGVEALAYVDRETQLAEEKAAQQAKAADAAEATRRAIEEVERDKTIPAPARRNIVRALTDVAAGAKTREVAAAEQVRQLEVMSLLGVLAGFMTHEFGAAISELDSAIAALSSLEPTANLSESVENLEGHKSSLRQFVQYATAYVRGAREMSNGPAYKALPRVRQTVKVLAEYALERRISTIVDVESNLPGPDVPAVMYNGVLLNLYSNALKAVARHAGASGKIAIRAWNVDSKHYLQVSDTGIGIPQVLRDRVFDPLFTTTAGSDDPLGSGMGLGLSVVRRTVDAFKGKVEIVDSPPGYATCFQVSLPLHREG